MKFIAHALLAGLAVSYSVPVAHAQSSTVVTAIKSAAWAKVFETKCSKLEMDWQQYARMMVVAGLRPEDIEPSGKHGQLHRAFIREALNHLENSSTAVICATGETLYGPRGRNLPDLLIPKR